MKNIMRPDAGVGGNIQRIETIGWMLFLKIWDAREADLELTETDFFLPVAKSKMVGCRRRGCFS